MKYFIGVDPGKLGGVSVIDTETGELTMHRIPLDGKIVDIVGIGDIFKKYKDSAFCVIENIHSIANVPATTNFSLGNTCGTKETWLVALEIPYVKISPVKWQSVMWLGVSEMRDKKGKKDTKGMSLVAAKRFFPKTTFLKSKDGLYEAALLAKYGEITYGKK